MVQFPVGPQLFVSALSALDLAMLNTDPPNESPHENPIGALLTVRDNQSVA